MMDPNLKLYCHRIFFSFILTSLCWIVGNNPLRAQSHALYNDSTPPKLTHQLGFQANALIRELMPVNTSQSNSLANPFSLFYSINSRKTGWGARFGFGYNQESRNTDDGVSAIKAKTTTYATRVGIEKLFRLSGKWTAGVGVDGLFKNDQNTTDTKVQSFDSTKTYIDSKSMRYGGGVMGWLRFAVTKHVLIGTETSFYYLTGKDKSKVTISRKDFNTPDFPTITNTTRTEDQNSEAKLSLPVAVYLIIRF
jgi:hypothetical protein